jgi:hypothetical protein
VCGHVPSRYHVAHAPDHLATVGVREHGRSACDVALKPCHDFFADTVAHIDWTDRVDLQVNMSIRVTSSVQQEQTTSTCAIPGCRRYVSPAHGANCSRTSCAAPGDPAAAGSAVAGTGATAEELAGMVGGHLLRQQRGRPQTPPGSCCGARIRRLRSWFKNKKTRMNDAGRRKGITHLLCLKSNSKCPSAS